MTKFMLLDDTRYVKIVDDSLQTSTQVDDGRFIYFVLKDRLKEIEYE